MNLLKNNILINTVNLDIKNLDPILETEDQNQVAHRVVKKTTETEDIIITVRKTTMATTMETTKTVMTMATNTKTTIRKKEIL